MGTSMLPMPLLSILHVTLILTMNACDETTWHAFYINVLVVPCTLKATPGPLYHAYVYSCIFKATSFYHLVGPVC